MTSLPMRYRYVTVHADTLCEMMQLVHEKDAFISSSAECEKILELFDQGYRWVRTDLGWAVLEREIKLK
jgi:hypothetical protein